MLPATFSQDPLEKFFGQARQRCGGNFYIDVADVLSSAKVQRLRQLLKIDITPAAFTDHLCPNCSIDIDEVDLEQLQDVSIEDTQLLLESTDTLKDKVIYVAGFLTHRYGRSMASNPEEECSISSTFVQELDRGGLSLPTLSTAFFVHTAIHMDTVLSPSKHSCREYFAKTLSYIDAPISENFQACRTLANVLLKAYVNNSSDKAKEIGCLRRREKLQ